MSVTDLLATCKEKLHIETHKKCILYDSQGGELSDDDVEYLNSEDPLFLSQGESFSKSSSLLLYNFIRPLGHGGFGSVSLYQHKQNLNFVAIKFISIQSLDTPEDINRVYSEIAALRELRHPNIVQLYQAFTLNNDICVMMEYCSGGELGAYLHKFGPLSGEKMYQVALQIVDAIRYCHNSKIVHRDLKLENILFASESYSMIKIVDFGIAGTFNKGKSGEKSNAGSLLYIPPEIYKREDNRASPALDVWAMGCIFYALLMGVHPFRQKTEKEMIEHIEKVKYKHLDSSIPRPWHKLIRGMLRLQPQKRWDTMRIQEHLEKYQECPDAEVSDESDVEEERKSLSSLTKTSAVSKTSSKLKVPFVHIPGKSHSPRRANIADPAFENNSRFPKSPAASHRNFYPVQGK